MTTGTGKIPARINMEIDPEIRRKVIGAMHKGETLRGFVEAALLAEVERRQRGSGPAPEPPVRLPPGRRPK